jgi:2-keto-3-deoxy-L-rhamnonate aldolase RhmA
MAIGSRQCASIVRIAWNEMPRFKRALDLGASGIMVPYIQSAEEAKAAVSYLRYPPDGVRGAAISPRAAGYGAGFDDYFSKANDNLLSVHQIETSLAVKNAGDIAAVDGVDVLFIGPLDLSLSLNMPDRFDDPEFRTVLSQVARIAGKAGKAAGILLPSVELIDMAHEMGFTFIAVGSDSGMVVQGMKNNINALNRYK